MRRKNRPGWTSEEIIRLCAQGDADARSKLVEHLQPVVERAVTTVLLTRGAVSNERVEDLTQEIFLSIFSDDCRKLRQFQGRNGCSLAGWIRVVSIRTAIDSLRKEGRSRISPCAGEQPQELLEAIPAQLPDPEQQLAAREALKRLRTAIDRLHKDDRILMELHFGRSLGMEHIAPIMGSTVNALYIRKSRLLQRLRKLTGWQGFPQGRRAK